MKTKISHLGRSSVSVILAVMMLLSTMLIGTVSTVNATSNKFTEGETIYLDLSYFTHWEDGTPTPSMYAYFYDYNTKDLVGDKIPATKVTDHIYSVTVPNANCGYIQFQRGDWNKTAEHDADTKGTNNCVKVSNWDGSSSWSTYSGGSTTEKSYYVAGQKELINGTQEWGSTDLAANKMEYNTDGYYSITYTDKAPGTYQFKITDNNSEWYGYDAFTVEKGNGCTVGKSDENYKNISVTFTQKSNVTIKFNIDSENNKHLYVIAESALSKVANSVTLTASSETVKVGDSVTLTAVADNPIPANLKYTFTKTSGGDATVVQDNDKLTVTPTVAGTYKYTVTVSADGYSPVTSNEVSFTVTDSVKYYICGRFKTTWHDPLVTDPQFVEDESNPGLFYYETGETIAQLSGTISETYNNTTSDYPRYFYVNRAATKDNNYLTAGNGVGHNFQNNTVNTPLALMSSSGTKEEYLVRFNNDKDTSTTPVTIWLDTRNNEYKLWYTTALPHKVTVENGVSAYVDKETATAGEKVTVTATSIPQGQILDKVTVKGEDNKPVTTTVSGNTATFTMPDQDVIVTNVTFRKAKECKVTIANNITNGSVTANDSSSEITVTEGNSVKLVATPNDSYSFISWSITPEDGYYTADGSMTSATATIYPTANITVSASFAKSTVSTDHFLAWGDGGKENIADWTHGVNTHSSTDENGYKVYTADLDISFFKQNTWYCFAVTNKIPSSDNHLNQDDLLYNHEKITVNGFKEYHEGDNVKTERKNNSGNYFGMFQYSGELVSLSISYNEGTNNYQVTPVVKVHKGAKLYAKNGSCRTDKQYANDMYTKGTTTISYDTTKYDVDVDTKSSTSYQLAYLSEENIKDEVKLTITTKVRDSKYYLAGWCVDGETYLPKTSDTKNNEYSFDYYVKSTTKPNDTIEVTPVYFYKTSTDTETVRFYVTGFDDTVKKDWGNTIAVYPYYSGGTGGDVFSNYPGQPMLVSGGRCYVDLPITYKGGTIAGVTLNNYFYDDVHNKLVSDNRQTYDYNDFLKIYEQKIKGSTERKSQEIIFSFKYVPSDTGYNNFGDNSTGKGDKTSVTYPDTISADDMDTLYANGWEDLTDFYGNKVDLYNKKVDASSDAGKKNPWRVISNGYEQTYFGYYATRWAVYKPDADTGSVTSYSLVDVISSSSLLYNSYEAISADKKTYSAGDTSLSASSDAEAYKAFTDAGADGVPVKITYEQTNERDNSIEGKPNMNQNAFRNDGRWYYSEDNLNVTAHTIIEYANTLDDFSGTLGTNFFRDYYQKGEVDYTKDGYDSSIYTGLITKTSAYFTNDEYYKKTEAKGQTGTGNTFDIIANTDHASQYIFVGWYLLSEGKYSPLTSTVENIVSVPQDNNDVYVARFIKAPSGSLTISHKLHPDTTGLGKCYVSVDVLDSAGKVIHSYDETTSDITVSNAYITYNQGNKIKITLRTVPGEASTFTDFYSYSSEFAKLVNTAEGVVPAVAVTKNPADGTYKAEISFNVDDYLFDNDSADHPQKIKVLNYFSQLSLGSVKYEIKYTFDTRLYGPKVYKVSDVLTKEDIEKYGCSEKQLSESFVMAKAPFESNFKQNITWDSNKITFGSKADGTLTADITATQVDDRNVTATFYVDSDSPTENITTIFGNRFFKDGSYISANSAGTTYNVEGLPVAYKGTSGDFSFWYVMTKNKEFVTKAYGQNFAYTGYDNYIVVAVYGVGGTHKDESTVSSINFLQYSRNHWNDTVSGENGTGSYSSANTEYDRLYADFNLMFNHNGFLLNKYSGTPNIKVGYAMVVGSKTDGNYTVDQEELKTAILSNATDGGTVEHQSTSVTAKQAVKVTNSDNDDVKKNVIVNSIRIADLDNKNRITSYYGFKNSVANQSYYVKVYSYVIVDNKVTLSETPVVINLNDIGNKTYVPQQ